MGNDTGRGSLEQVGCLIREARDVGRVEKGGGGGGVHHAGDDEPRALLATPSPAKQNGPVAWRCGEGGFDTRAE